MIDEFLLHVKQCRLTAPVSIRVKVWTWLTPVKREKNKDPTLFGFFHSHKNEHQQRCLVSETKCVFRIAQGYSSVSLTKAYCSTELHSLSGVTRWIDRQDRMANETTKGYCSTELHLLSGVTRWIDRQDRMANETTKAYCSTELHLLSGVTRWIDPQDNGKWND